MNTTFAYKAVNRVFKQRFSPREVYFGTKKNTLYQKVLLAIQEPVQ